MKRLLWFGPLVLAASGCETVLGIHDLELEPPSSQTMYQWTYDAPTSGFFNLDAEVRPRNDPDASHYGIFYAHQFQIVGGSAGYIGLQTDNLGKRAIMSIWDATAVRGNETPAGDRVACSVDRSVHCEGSFAYETQSEDGALVNEHGYQAMVPLEWQAGHHYRFSVSKAEESSESGSWWNGSIIDDDDGARVIPIAQFLVPTTWKGLDGWSTTFIDYYSRDGKECASGIRPAADFSPPTADDGRERATLLASGSPLCSGAH